MYTVQYKRYTSLKNIVLLTLSLLATPLVVAMELTKEQSCRIRTQDGVRDLAIDLVRYFSTAQGALAEFSPGTTETVDALAITTGAFDDVVDLVKLYRAHEQSPEAATFILEACQKGSIRSLIRIVKALNFLEGPDIVLTSVLCALAEKVDASKFHPDSAEVCRVLDEIPVDIQAILNEIFLLKHGNLQDLTKQVCRFAIPQKNVAFAATSTSGRYLLLQINKEELWGPGLCLLYDLCSNPIRCVCEIETNRALRHNHGFSEDENYAALIESDHLHIIDLTSGVDHKLKLPEEFLSPDVVRGLAREVSGDRDFYELETDRKLCERRPSDLSEFMIDDEDGLMEILRRAQLETTDASAICKKALPHLPAFVAISGKYLELRGVDNSDFRVLDISNPQDSKECFVRGDCFPVKLDRNVVYLIPIGAYPDRVVGRPNPIVPGNLGITRLQYPRLKWLALNILLTDKVRRFHKDKFIVQRGSEWFLGIYVESLGELAFIKIANLSQWIEFDEFITGEEHVGTFRSISATETEIELRSMPLSRLKMCPTSHVIMILNALKDSRALENPYFKECYATLDESLKELYFGNNRGQGVV